MIHEIYNGASDDFCVIKVTHRKFGGIKYSKYRILIVDDITTFSKNYGNGIYLSTG